MVLIGGVKYACERCIRGHRVTTCNHTDQPLIMIKPKGRPSSQCKHCKNLRVNKNVHTSSSCTCGQQTSSGVKKKKCGCESGKTCDCHKKKAITRKPSINKSTDDLSKSGLSRSVSVSSTASIPKNSEGYSSKRVGEVVVPINEYVPNHPQHEIGAVFNEKAVNGIFQDVPLPFEPGHGLLDLFEPSPASTPTTSSGFKSSDQYRPPNQNNYYYSSYSNNNANKHDSSLNKHGNNNNNNTKSERIAPQLQHHNSSNCINVPANNNKPHAFNSQNFDLFHNLGLSPTTEPQSMTPTGHPIPHHQPSDTLVQSISNTTPSNSKSALNQQTTGSLFGNYSNYKVQSLDRESLTSRSEVEVCSVTPSFNDIKHADYLQSDSHLSHITSNINSGNSNSNKYISDSADGSTTVESVKDKDKFNINIGFFDSDLSKFKGESTEFPEMLKF